MGGIIITAAVIGVIGLVCGIALAFVAAKFAVKESPVAEAALAALPGANCGGCGFAGCADYAKAIEEKDAPINLCAPGGAEVARILGEITGKEAGDVKPMVALVRCSGDTTAAKKKYAYNGVMDCTSTQTISGGDKSCPYGCLGYGSCQQVCDAGAIEIVNGVAVVDRNICIGCGACVNACPRKLIRLVPKDRVYHVLCASIDKGAVANTYCKNGCIGCRICAKLDDAFVVDGFLAAADYSKPENPDSQAPAKCPRHCIRKA